MFLDVCTFSGDFPDLYPDHTVRSRLFYRFSGKKELPQQQARSWNTFQTNTVATYGRSLSVHLRSESAERIVPYSDLCDRIHRWRSALYVSVADRTTVLHLSHYLTKRNALNNIWASFWIRTADVTCFLFNCKFKKRSNAVYFTCSVTITYFINQRFWNTIFYFAVTQTLIIIIIIIIIMCCSCPHY
jgi:hypothetical protein